MADISKIKLPNGNTYNIKDASAVKGPSSSTADHIATFSDTTGKLIKDSGKSLSDYLPLAGGTMTTTSVVTNLNADRVDGSHVYNITNYYTGTNHANGTSTQDFWFKAALFYLASNSTLDVKATFLITSYYDYDTHPGLGILTIHARGNNSTTPFDTTRTNAKWAVLNSNLSDIVKVKIHYDNSDSTLKRYVRIYVTAKEWNRGISVKLLNSHTWGSANSSSWTMYNTPSTIATAADYPLGTELTITSNQLMFDANGGIKYSSGGSDTTFWNTNGGTKTAAEILSSAGGVTTDNKVFLATSTTTDYRPIILGKSTSSTESGSFSNTTDLSYYSNSLRVQPSTGNIISAGNVKAQTLSISSTSGVAHLDFARNAYNYILAKASGGKLCFIVNGQTLSTANCEAIIEDGAIYPGTTNVTDLGKSDYKWKNLYVTNINGITIPTDGTFSPVDRSVEQLYTSSTLNDAYRVLLSYLADNSDHTNSVRKSPKLTFNPSTGVLAVTGKVNASDGFFQTSDITKKNVKGELDLDKAYELIDKCQTIIYSLKDDKSNKEQIGMIAQEVKEFFPEIVEENDGVLSLDYARLTVVILRVLKDLIDRVKKLEG